MWKLPKLQLVFYLGIIGNIISLFITIIVSDFGYILSFSLLLAIATHVWNSISSSCSEATFSWSALFVLLFLVSLFFFSFLAFFFNLFDLKLLFDLVDLTLALTLKRQAGFLRSFRLIVSKIKAHLQKLFSFGALLI